MHVTCHGSLSKTILQGTSEGGRHRGQQRKCWMNNIKVWTSLPMPELLTGASCRKDWKRVSAALSLMPTPHSVKGMNYFSLLTTWACNSTTVNQWE